MLTGQEKSGSNEIFIRRTFSDTLGDKCDIYLTNIV